MSEREDRERLRKEVAWKEVRAFIEMMGRCFCSDPGTGDGFVCSRCKAEEALAILGPEPEARE